jgi:hypothetical protein
VLGDHLLGKLADLFVLQAVLGELRNLDIVLAAVVKQGRDLLIGRWAAAGNVGLHISSADADALTIHSNAFARRSAGGLNRRSVRTPRFANVLGRGYCDECNGNQQRPSINVSHGNFS